MSSATTLYDMIILNGSVMTPGGEVRADIGVQDGKIKTIGSLPPTQADRIFDAEGLFVLPGVIDSQVHFREPGLEHKEDLESGTRAAALGGVTSVFEMPNTTPPTSTREALEDKLSRANGRAYVDHAFFIGATADNIDNLSEIESLPGCAGVKIFMGSSTGTLLLADEAALLQVLQKGRRRVAVHCEDEARLIERKALVEGGADVNQHPVWRDATTAYLATQRLLTLARKAWRRVHVLHVTTEQEMVLLADYKDIASCEVTPQHLSLYAPDCYEGLGTFAQMNPPIRDKAHFDALWQAVDQGIVDVIGSDHAPHSRAEKQKPYPHSPSGMPGVQTLLPVMLHHVTEGRLSLARLVDLTSAGPARLYGIAGKGRIAVGYDADFTLVDLQAKRRIEEKWIASKCGWSPFTDMEVTGWPIATILRGEIIMQDDEVIPEPKGKPVRFHETRPGLEQNS